MSAVDPTAARLSGLRVLIVEDEPILSMCLAESLASNGCVVAGEAATVPAALSLVETAAFDVAVLDLNLWGQRTDAVAAAVVRGGRALVFSTGSTRDAIPVEFQHWPILRKPYKDAAIVEALADAAPRLPASGAA